MNGGYRKYEQEKSVLQKLEILRKIVIGLNELLKISSIKRNITN